MELIHNIIPLEFLNTLPEGIKFINKHGKEFLVIEELYCPKGHGLMVESVKIHGEPSIKIDVKIGDQQGAFFIDAFWGSHTKLYSFIPKISKEPVIVEAFCPTCGESMMVDDQCQLKGCESNRAILFFLPGKKNKIYVCAKLGCPGHRIEISRLPHYISEAVSDINFFGAQAEDIFRGI
ncbi:MAG: hypothetical protein DRP87_13595 [Spirochaetes bacterium]|nr:MAG: hypothetical protein DRP87_13595 [Spirochaetota bacterium]